MRKKIVFVDDERQILRALNRIFLDCDYEIILMDSGEEALAFMEHESVDLIVSDIRMPGMNGFDLLRKVKEQWPSTIRVALSGYTDSRAIYKALEANVAKMYLFKPWDNKELLGMIGNLLKLEETLRDKNILNLINNLDNLPTLPTLYTKISRMIQEEEDVERIAKLIEQDQATSSKILRISNSAFYGAKTGSISQAIMYIGLTNVKSIVLSNGIFNIEGPYNKQIQQLWENATLTNCLTNHLYYRILGKKIPNAFASAGLLHNIGMVVLICHFGTLYGDLFASNENLQKILSREKEMLGVTHPELGGYLLNWWELPLPIVEAALYHHAPLQEGVINRELLSIVHIANQFAWRMVDPTYVILSQVEECCDFLGTSLDFIEKAVLEIPLETEDSK